MKNIAANITKFELIDLINESVDLLSFVDRDYIYRAANQAYSRYFNRPIDQIVNHSVASVIGEAMFETISKPNLDRAFLGENLTYEGWYNFPKTERVYLAVRYVCSYNENGDVTGCIVTATDLTERKKLEEENAFYEQLLIEASRKAQLGEMIAFIAHQWRGPLNRLSTRLLQMRHRPNSISENDFITLENIMKNLSTTIDDLYELYHHPIEKEMTINDLLLQAKSLMEYRLLTRQINVEINGDTVCRIVMQNSYILHLLIVFLENGIDILDPLPQPIKRIVLQGQCRENEIIFDIYDNAMGISFNDPYTVFLPGVSTKSGGRHGYGLYFAHKIVTDYLHGKIEIIQHHQGSWFRITLPKIHTAVIK